MQQIRALAICLIIIIVKCGENPSLTTTITITTTKPKSTAHNTFTTLSLDSSERTDALEDESLEVRYHNPIPNESKDVDNLNIISDETKLKAYNATSKTTSASKDALLDSINSTSNATTATATATTATNDKSKSELLVNVKPRSTTTTDLLNLNQDNIFDDVAFAISKSQNDLLHSAIVSRSTNENNEPKTLAANRTAAVVIGKEEAASRNAIENPNNSDELIPKSFESKEFHSVSYKTPSFIDTILNRQSVTKKVVFDSREDDTEEASKEKLFQPHQIYATKNDNKFQSLFEIENQNSKPLFAAKSSKNASVDFDKVEGNRFNKVDDAGVGVDEDEDSIELTIIAIKNKGSKNSEEMDSIVSLEAVTPKPNHYYRSDDKIFDATTLTKGKATPLIISLGQTTKPSNNKQHSASTSSSSSSEAETEEHNRNGIDKSCERKKHLKNLNSTTTIKTIATPISQRINNTQTKTTIVQRNRRAVTYSRFAMSKSSTQPTTSMLDLNSKDSDEDENITQSARRSKRQNASTNAEQGMSNVRKTSGGLSYNFNLENSDGAKTPSNYRNIRAITQTIQPSTTNLPSRNHDDNNNDNDDDNDDNNKNNDADDEDDENDDTLSVSSEESLRNNKFNASPQKTVPKTAASSPLTTADDSNSNEHSTNTVKDSNHKIQTQTPTIKSNFSVSMKSATTSTTIRTATLPYKNLNISKRQALDTSLFYNPYDNTPYSDAAAAAAATYSKRYRNWPNYGYTWNRNGWYKNENPKNNNLIKSVKSKASEGSYESTANKPINEPIAKLQLQQQQQNLNNSDSNNNRSANEPTSTQFAVVVPRRYGNNQRYSSESSKEEQKFARRRPNFPYGRHLHGQRSPFPPCRRNHWDCIEGNAGNVSPLAEGLMRFMFARQQILYNNFNQFVQEERNLRQQNQLFMRNIFRQQQPTPRIGFAATVDVDDDDDDAFINSVQPLGVVANGQAKGELLRNEIVKNTFPNFNPTTSLHSLSSTKPLLLVERLEEATTKRDLKNLMPMESIKVKPAVIVDNNNDQNNVVIQQQQQQQPLNIALSNENPKETRESIEQHKTVDFSHLHCLFFSFVVSLIIIIGFYRLYTILSKRAAFKQAEQLSSQCPKARNEEANIKAVHCCII